jgi:hypothetical protein
LADAFGKLDLALLADVGRMFSRSFRHLMSLRFRAVASHDLPGYKPGA